MSAASVKISDSNGLTAHHDTMPNTPDPVPVYKRFTLWDALIVAIGIALIVFEASLP
jgi:hypothetical protein